MLTLRDGIELLSIALGIGLIEFYRSLKRTSFLSLITLVLGTILFSGAFFSIAWRDSMAGIFSSWLVLFIIALIWLYIGSSLILEEIKVLVANAHDVKQKKFDSILKEKAAAIYDSLDDEARAEMDINAAAWLRATGSQGLYNQRNLALLYIVETQLEK